MLYPSAEVLPSATLVPGAAVMQGPAWRPTVQEVARFLPTRLIASMGHRASTFNDTTTPTGLQVQGIIDQAAAEVLLAVPDPVPFRLNPSVRSAISLSAAMWIELTYNAEQVGTDKSPFEQLSTAYDRLMALLGSRGNDNEPNRPRFGSLRVGTIATENLGVWPCELR